MKVIIFITLFILPFGLFSQNDTLNQVDSEGKKQGYWIIYGKDEPEKRYPAEGKIAEGTYKDDRKHGEWKLYYRDGVTVRIKGGFENSRPIGEYETYDIDGKLLRKGPIIYCRGLGCLDTNNKVEYNEFGKTLFYFEDGSVEMECTFNNGVPIDTVKRYYPNGDLKELIIFDSSGVVINSYSKPQGIRDSSGREVYRISKPPLNEISTLKNMLPKVEPCPQSDKVFDKNRELLYEGEFKDCRLWNGKYYIYDKDGLLMKVEIWKEGKYFGEGQL